jgi:hypothetical protein
VSNVEDQAHQEKKGEYIVHYPCPKLLPHRFLAPFDGMLWTELKQQLSGYN